MPKIPRFCHAKTTLKKCDAVSCLKDLEFVSLEPDDSL